MCLIWLEFLQEYHNDLIRLIFMKFCKGNYFFVFSTSLFDCQCMNLCIAHRYGGANQETDYSSFLHETWIYNCLSCLQASYLNAQKNSNGNICLFEIILSIKDPCGRLTQLWIEYSERKLLQSVSWFAPSHWCAIYKWLILFLLGLLYPTVLKSLIENWH